MTWGPLLLTDDPARVPAALRGYLLDLKPGYIDDPTRAVYNHVWLIGDQDAISVGFQAQVDDLAEVAQVRSGAGTSLAPQPGPSEQEPARPSQAMTTSRDSEQMSEAERPDRLASGRKVTVEDIRALAGPSTPHFALQIRNRIQRLIDGLEEADPARIEGELQIARLDRARPPLGRPARRRAGDAACALGIAAARMPPNDRADPDAVRRAGDLLRPEAAERSRDPGATAAGYLDLLGGELESTGAVQDLMTTRIVPAIYERYWRPALARMVKGFTGPGMAEEIRIARLLLGLGPGDTVLDVACGPGNFSREFAPRGRGPGPGGGDRRLADDARPGGERPARLRASPTWP